MSMKISRSGLRGLMESISNSFENDPEIMKLYMGDEPEQYGPPSREDLKAAAENEKIVAAFRERLLDDMPNVDHDK